MTKTDNEKYVKRGADMFIEYNPEWEDEVSHTNKGKVGAPYQYSETLIMLAAALRVGLGVRYRQLEGTVGKMIGESRTPSFSQLRKRMGRLDVSTYQGGMITVSDPGQSRILAADATGLKQHNRGEWMGKKWRVKRGFVKLRVMVDTQTMKIVALSVTDESVGDVTEFRSLLGQGMDAVGGAEGGSQAIPEIRGRTPRPGSRAAPRPAIPYTKTVSRRASRPLHRSARTIRTVVNRRHPISCTAMPRTAQGATWPRVRV